MNAPEMARLRLRQAEVRNRHLLEAATKQLIEEPGVGEKEYHVVTEGGSGNFRANSALEAKQLLIARMQRNRHEQPPLTRNQRRYLTKRAVAYVVGK